MPKDNLLNSACLELFETIRSQKSRPILEHLVLTHRARLREITYVDTFNRIIIEWEEMKHPPPSTDQDMTLFSNDGDDARTPERRYNVNGNRWQGMKEMDAAEQAYFDASDDEDEATDIQISKKSKASNTPMTNGLAPSPIIKSLVDYPDDDDDDALESLPTHPSDKKPTHQPKLAPSPMLQTPPPERLSEKRRREDEDDEDELGKLSTISSKRRYSGSYASLPGNNGSPAGNNILRRKKGFFATKDKDTLAANRSATAAGEAKKKIAISIGGAVKTPPAASSEPEGKGDDVG